MSFESFCRVPSMLVRPVCSYSYYVLNEPPKKHKILRIPYKGCIGMTILSLFGGVFFFFFWGGGGFLSTWQIGSGLGGAQSSAANR